MQKRETLLLAVAVPLLVLLLMYAPKLFKFSTVEVSKEPARVEKKIFDIKHPPTEVGKEESVTFYTFGCDSDLDYDLEEKTQSSNGIWQVRLKVTRARVALTLPITIWLSQIIPNHRADFEEGHAKICKRVYVDAHIPAKAACKRVIGKVYYGQNKDLELAKKQAIGQAKSEVSTQYIDAVNNKVKDVFVIYDFYAPSWKKSTEILVDKALQEYEVGKPRKLSSTGIVKKGSSKEEN